MTEHSTTCDATALDRLLDGQLNDAARVALESHLEGCAACCARLEESAAAPAEWVAARQSLSSIDELPVQDGLDQSQAGDAGRFGEGDVPRAEHIRSFLTATDDPRMLGRFGGYEIAGIIGCGGMGIVLKGLDVALNRFVAIKVLAPHLATSAAARTRFAREARAAAAVVHENVIAIHAVSEANGLPYLVMPYDRGSSLQRRIDSQGPLSALEVLRIGRQVAAGLAAAHAQGLVHRDIKPANILLEDGVERLTITDFGLARAADDASLTRSGVIAGTPQFMSPEQARGEAIDRRSDLFSLGSVLYALCTGRSPFRAESPYGVLRRITDDHPRPIRELNPEIPEWLAAIIGRLHAKLPGDRFASADEVADLLQQCLAHVQQPDLVPLPADWQFPQAIRFSALRRRWRGIAVGAACLLTALALVAINRGLPPAGQRDGGSQGAARNPAGDLVDETGAGLLSGYDWDDCVGELLETLGQDVGDAERAFGANEDRKTDEPGSASAQDGKDQRP